jgi:hypothetical protein
MLARYAHQLGKCRIVWRGLLLNGQVDQHGE